MNGDGGFVGISGTGLVTLVELQSSAKEQYFIGNHLKTVKKRKIFKT